MLNFPANGSTQQDAYAKARRRVGQEIGELIERLKDAVAAYDDLGGGLPSWWREAFSDLLREEGKRE